MKRVLLAAAILVGTSYAVSAQTGKNQVSIGPELGLSTESGGGTTIGGTAKYLHGVGSAGQVTLTVGYGAHSESEEGLKATASYMPFLAGYRHYFSGIFVEPQAGYIRSKVTLKEDGQKLFSGSDGAFGYGIGGGYAFANGLDLGVSFRNTAQSGASGLLVFRVGYNFSLGGASK